LVLCALFTILWERRDRTREEERGVEEREKESARNTVRCIKAGSAQPTTLLIAGREGRGSQKSKEKVSVNGLKRGA